MCITASHQTSPAGSPLRRFAWYRRAQARALERDDNACEHQLRAAKEALLGRLRGTVLEIGAGAGSNVPFYEPGIRYLAVEPNPAAVDALKARTAKRGLSAELYHGVAEALPVPDSSVDAVVSTLVLCSVTDLPQTLAEVRRVLRPGGRFIFIEHVAAPNGTVMRAVQRVLRTPQRILADGCRPDQDTASAISAAGFQTVLLCPDRFRGAYPVPFITGIAIR